MRRLILILACAIVSAFFHINANITHYLLFSQSSLQTEAFHDGEPFTRIQYKGLQNISDPGRPSIPVQSCLFYIPYDATDFRLEVTNSAGTSIKLHEPLVIEGRTWWYDAGYYGTVEYGIRIGSAVEIDGVEWNKVYVCLQRKDIDGPKPYDTTCEWTEYGEDEGLLAYIREADGKVYAMKADNAFSAEKKPVAIMDNSPLFFNPKGCALIYDFSNDGAFQLGGDGHDSPSIGFDIVGLTEVESCGKTYTTMICSPASSQYVNSTTVCFTKGIGITGERDENGATNGCSLFYAPFYMSATNGMYLNSLRYVTDSEDNVIYEGTGGDRLWETYREASVGTLSASKDDAGVEYFNLQGLSTARPAPGTLVLKKEGGAVTKTIVRE